MIKNFALLALSYLAHAAASCGPSSNTSTYLHVTLWDSFGDGWQNAWWMMNDPALDTIQEQSDCENIEKVFDVYPCDHTPANGLYYMIVQTPDESLPEGWWEIYWKVEVMNGDNTPTGIFYEGWYNTTMVWNYDIIDDSWDLLHHENRPDFSCTNEGSACEKGEADKEAPKKKRDPKENRKGPLKGKGPAGNGGSADAGGDNSTVAANTTSTESSTATASTQGFEYGPRNTKLSVNMFSEECNGWGEITGFPLAASWYIVDSSKTEIFDQGSLCEVDSCDGTSEICLGDGSYVFRVTGPTFNETLEEIYFRREGVDPEDENIDHSIIDKYYYQSWEFCHARGHYNEQLNFHIKGGQCIPDDLRWADEICDAMENSTVTVLGEITLSGLQNEIFQSSESSLVLSILASVVEGWSTSRMEILSTYVDASTFTSDFASKTTYSHGVRFSVNFIAEDYGIDGATYDAVSNLVSDMAATIEASFSTGIFSTRLATAARLSGGQFFSAVNKANLVSLEVSQISYSHNHLVYYYETSSSSSSQASGSMSTAMILLMVFVGVAVVAAVSGLVAHKFVGGYNQLSTESEHFSGSQIEIARSPFGFVKQSDNEKL